MAAIIRVGKVSSIDYQKGLVSVVYHDADDNTTRQLPMLAPSGWYDMPEVEDMVLVVHLSNGPEAGVVLGRYRSDKNAPKESGAGLFRVDLNRDGSMYAKCAEGVITVKGDVTLEGDLTVNGDIDVTGDVSVDGGITTTGGVTASGDVKAGNVSLKNHVHTDSEGGTTSGPR